ncbi:hypothetical protein PUN28_012871 [Cardiocondyla obscurior]|uniref:Uncharacterized protein n=1 Tax=Cardiocondyla obscurior TaxID=286306 RepID=A0AAW2FBC1_9HYME
MVDKVDNEKYTECIDTRPETIKFREQLHAADKKKATNNCEDGKWASFCRELRYAANKW